MRSSAIASTAQAQASDASTKPEQVLNFAFEINESIEPRVATSAHRGFAQFTALHCILSFRSDASPQAKEAQ